MNNKFISNFISLATGSGLNIIIGLLTTPIITRLVSPNDYGNFSLFTMYSNLVLMFLVLGLDQSFVRWFYKNDDVKYKSDLLYNCIKIPIGICVMMFILLLIGVFWNNNEYICGKNLVYLVFFFTVFIALINRFSFLVVRLQYKAKSLSSLLVAQKVIYVISVILFSIVLKRYFFLILIISNFLSLIIVTAISIVLEKDIWRFRKVKYRHNNLDLIKYGFPLMISSSINVIFQSADRYVIGIYGSNSDVGIYASALSIINIFSIIQTSFNTIWMPTAIEHYEKEKEDKQFYANVNQVITVLMFILGLSLILIKDVIVLFLGEKYREASFILPFLIFHPIMYTISETTVVGIYFKKRPKMQVIVAIVSCVANIAGNIILVPLLGSKGAAISTGVSYIIFFALRTHLANRLYYIDFKLKKFYVTTFLVIIYAALNSFYTSGIWSVFIYIVSCSFIFILYKDVLINGLNFMKKYIRKNI
ncbi:hypothetical protein D7V67_12770 [Clostridium paraputrificum]|uniref:oligosaccharide flippase family protein n=1 Tax=Clostridium paraputrificum TaxID=29363 RepID=UPI000EA2980B|nr:oligosaccharide flippase family protein [Clostridium paraputrificum]RKI46912.1 hypothetical protein D7V67_12770 [Clostridium paraputrificum]